MVKREKTEVEPKDVAELRSGGMNWKGISEQLGISPGRAMFLFEVSQVNSKNKITGKDEEELNKNIAAARAEGLSWGIISARSGMTEGYCRSAYQSVTGKSALGNRIGKGGRFPKGERPEKAPVAKTAKAVKAAKPEKATKAAKTTKAVKTSSDAPVKKSVKKAVKKSAPKEAA